MWSALSSLQFGSLSALFAALAIPLLVLAYLKRQQRKKTIVSSLILLKSLTPQATTKRRFRPPLRFFLELLALCALVLAATAPAFKSPGSHTALLIDTSMSSAAQNGSGERATTRLGIALDALRSWLTNQSEGQTYTLFTSAPKMNRIGNQELSRSELSKLLDQVKTTWSNDSFDGALLELAESGNYDRVIGFTDRNILESENPTAFGERPDEQTRIQVFQVGSPAENYYLGNVQLNRSRDSKASVTASIRFSGSTPITLLAELSPVSKSGQVKKAVRTRRLQAVPNRNNEMTFTLPAKASKAVGYRVQLRTPDAKDKSRNALSVDDTAWVSDSSSGSLRVLLVSSNDDLLGLNRIPGISVESSSPTDFASLSAADLNRFSLLVFHRNAPSFIPATASLLILPPGGNPIFPVLGEAENPKITSWARDSPITRYLRVPLITPSSTVFFDVPAWAQSVISVEQGTVLSAGETGGVRLAAAGIELLPFEGKQTPGLSILTLNLINWLTGSNELQSGFVTSSTTRLESGKSWIVRDPNGAIETIDVPDSATRFYSFNDPGIYSLSSIVPGTTKVAQARTQLYTVNAFHPEESATFTPAVIAVPEVVYRESVAIAPEKPLWPWLAALALIVLSLEFFHHLLAASPQEELA